MTDTSIHHGSCLCGSVRFDATAPLRDVFACHCTQCRRTSGHYWGATSVPLDRFRLTQDSGLRWFVSSDHANRGFCVTCGASLFFRPNGEGRMGIAPGAFDGPTGITTVSHWHREDAGDYYAPEGAPPAATSAPDVLNCACLCGGVAFSLPGPAGDLVACHCTQCRKLSGYYAASFDVDEAALTYTAQTTLAEFMAPGGSQRGFCAACGSSLWFRAADDAFSVEAGAVTGATGGRLTGHIFAADKGDYYTLDDGLPQAAGGA
jgi:hypothetical protein